jgi:hypothetical protein
MKKILLISLAVCLALSFTSCEDQLDSTNYTKANTGNFPARAADLTAELNAAYSVLNKFSQDPLQNPYFVFNLMSDECNGGGGTGDVESHAVGHIMYNKDDLYDKAWAAVYAGVTRSGTIIYSVDNVNWGTNTTERNQLLGEAYFLRALYYFWGSQMFGNIPAYWQAGVPVPCPQQDAETVIYPHIMADLVSAASLMTQKTQGDGHATKYAAEALLARVYMFYQGFYKKAGELATANLADVELPEQEGVSGALTKAAVVSALEDVINNGGYSLLGDYRNLWQYTNELTVANYSFTSSGSCNMADTTFVNGTVKTGVDGKPLAWGGNGNAEEIFQIQYMNAESWNGTTAMGYSNQASLYSGLRCDADANSIANGGPNTFPFGQGWGQGTVNAQVWDDWSSSDPRKTASILDCATELAQFAYTTSCTEDAGLYNKKLLPVTCSKTNWNKTTVAYTWWACLDDTYTPITGNSFQGDHFADLMLIRLADVYLMHSELTGTATYMNKVRARAGLNETTYSWSNIKEERKHELAFEGLRFNDLRRWSGINGGSSCEAAVAIQKKSGTRVNYTGKWTTMHHASSSWAQRYAETDGFLRIPPTQISLVGDETILKQNAGWGSDVSDAAMTGTPVY